MNLRQLFIEISGGWGQAKNEQFTGHPIAILLRQDLIKAIKNKLPPSANYLIKASAGAGNWADIPWLSILNPSITESTQSGIYPVYLFRSDGSGLYLSLGFGTTELKKKYGTALAKQKAEELRNSIRGGDHRLNAWDKKIDLRSNTTLGKSYEWASAGAKFYPVENMPDEDTLASDLKELLDVYADVSLDIDQQAQHSTSNAQALSKPFLLLAGISGTGKTRFVREQAQNVEHFPETYCLTSVRPDWHEPSDLLGYVSRLGQQPQYIATDVLRFIVRAWKTIIKSIDFDANGKAIDWTGRDLQDIPPYWLCLDEMNLAPVEQYFADYLSILETRRWNDPQKLSSSGRDYIYECDPLIKGEIFSALDADVVVGDMKPSERLAKDLGFDLTKKLDNDIWFYFLEHGISIPFNLIVAGTVNMDETTHGFSRKVIDRALSFDFGEFFPNDFTEFFAKKYQNKKLSYPIFSHISQDDLASTVDVDGSKTVAFLSEVNAVLKNTPFELAFRALNELLLAVASSQPQDDLTLQAVWDDFIMCKVLPRIEGDEDKLMGAPPSDDNILQLLKDVLAQQLADIWNTERPDLYREDIENPDDKVMVLCRSKKKLDWMNDQLIRGFVSFWP